MQFLSPHWWLVLVGLLLVALTYVVMVRRNKNEVSNAIKYTVWVLRTGTILVLLFFLAQPYFSIIHQEAQKPALWVAFDYSESMKPFATAVKGIQQNFEFETSALQDKYDVSYLAFGSQTVSADDAVYQKTTNFSNVSNHIQAIKTSDKSQLVVVSDGIFNQGQNPLFDPSWNFPVHTIGVGDTAVKKDIFLQEVRSNKTVFKGNETPLNITLSAQLLKGVKATVNIRENGKVLFSETFTIASDDALREITTAIALKEVGMHTLLVEVSVPENEPLANNKTKVYVEVQDVKKRLLCISEAPHPDVRMLVHAWKKIPEYQIQILQGFDRLDTVDFSKVDLLVLHKPSEATISKLNKHLPTLPVWWITGHQVPSSFWKKLNTGVQIQGANGQSNTVGFSWNKEISLFNLANEQLADLADASPVEVPFGKFSVTTGTQVLAHQQVGNITTAYPLITLSKAVKNKSGVWIGEGFWKWQLSTFNADEEQSAFEQLALKFTRLMLTKENKEPLVCYAPQSILEGEKWKLTGNVFNASFEASREAEVKLMVTDSAGVPFTFDPMLSGNDYNFLVSGLTSGNYTYEVAATLNEKKDVVKGKLLVKSMNLEQFNTTANFGFLRKWSEKTGGIYAAKEQVNSFIKTLLKNAPATIVTEQKQQKSILDLWWLLFIPVVLLGVEWFVRKRSGMI